MGVIIFLKNWRRTNLLRISQLNQKHLLYPHFTDVFEGILSVNRIDRFLEILLFTAVYSAVNSAVNICKQL